jgi:outer membrane lipoprotein SlyB
VAVSEVTKKDTHLGAGTAIGAVAGGVLGNQVGKGDGRKAATVAGAVAGGAIGHSVEKNNRETRYAWRFSVDMDNGRRVTVTQNDNPDIRSGDRVRVYNGRLERF